MYTRRPRGRVLHGGDFMHYTLYLYLISIHICSSCQRSWTLEVTAVAITASRFIVALAAYYCRYSHDGRAALTHRPQVLCL